MAITDLVTIVADTLARAIAPYTSTAIFSRTPGSQPSGVGKMHDFETFEGRNVRYNLMWSLYQNATYAKDAPLSSALKEDLHLYQYIRSILSAAFRIVDFHHNHMLGGPLDKNAGDNTAVESAIPIVGASDTMRTIIAALWADARMPIMKDVLSLQGAVFGDAFLGIGWDGNELSWELVPPLSITEISFDRLGRVLHYVREEERVDPENITNLVTFREVCTTEFTGEVRFATYLNGEPYAWRPLLGEEYSFSWGRCPMLHVKHHDTGQLFGWSELFPGLSKFFEIDDLGSKMSDQIRQSVHPGWLFAGLAPPDDNDSPPTATVERPDGTPLEPDETPVFYATDPRAKAQALVANLDLSATLEYIKFLGDEIRRDYPEMQLVLLHSGGRGDISGRALLIARQQAVDKVLSRRTNYDELLIDAHRLSAAIGGDVGLDGFPFTIEDWDSDATDHEIGDRQVFRQHESEIQEEQKQLWGNAKASSLVGVPLEIFLRRNRWPQDQIDEILNSDEYAWYRQRLFNEAQGLSSSGDSTTEPVEGITDPGVPGPDFQVQQ